MESERKKDKEKESQKEGGVKDKNTNEGKGGIKGQKDLNMLRSTEILKKTRVCTGFFKIPI